MKIEEWKEATRKAIDGVQKLFNPAELRVIYDFLETVSQDDIDGNVV